MGRSGNEDGVIEGFRLNQGLECYEAIVTKVGAFYAGDIFMIRDCYTEEKEAMFLCVTRSRNGEVMAMAALTPG